MVASLSTRGQSSYRGPVQLLNSKYVRITARAYLQQEVHLPITLTLLQVPSQGAFQGQTIKRLSTVATARIPRTAYAALGT